MKEKLYNAIYLWTVVSRRWGISKDEILENFPEIEDVEKNLSELSSENRISSYIGADEFFYVGGC